MRLSLLATTLVAAIVFGTSVGSSAPDSTVRMNHVQVLGTHNSYHLAPYPELQALITQFDPARLTPIQFSHRTLTEQLEVLGVRQVELDVFADPGPQPLYASPLGESTIKGPGSVPIAGLTVPGLKVFHGQDVDYRSTCLTFVACLQEIETWSNANPYHLPILIMVEAKDDLVELPAGIPPAVVPLPFGAAELQTIDDEIRSVFDAKQLLTPDDVRGERATLEEAVLKDGWPALKDVQGRVFFALDNQDAKRDDYIAGHPSLKGRVMFTSSTPGTPEAAFVKLNDPILEFEQIKSAVSAGYLVRTRADSDTLEARANNTAPRDAAFASGAQFVSTDYPEPDAALGTGYVVRVPGGEIGRCNPVKTVVACAPGEFELAPATPTPTTAPPTQAPPTATPGVPPTGDDDESSGAGGTWVLVAGGVALALAVAIGGTMALRRRGS
jgi:hypothetical protein